MTSTAKCRLCGELIKFTDGNPIELGLHMLQCHRDGRVCQYSVKKCRKINSCNSTKSEFYNICTPCIKEYRICKPCREKEYNEKLPPTNIETISDHNIQYYSDSVQQDEQYSQNQGPPRSTFVHVIHDNSKSTNSESPNSSQYKSHPNLHFKNPTFREENSQPQSIIKHTARITSPNTQVRIEESPYHDLRENPQINIMETNNQNSNIVHSSSSRTRNVVGNNNITSEMHSQHHIKMRNESRGQNTINRQQSPMPLSTADNFTQSAVKTAEKSCGCPKPPRGTKAPCDNSCRGKKIGSPSPPCRSTFYRRGFYKTSVETWRPGRRTILCPNCNKQVRPIVRSQRNKVAYTSIGAALLLSCWPFCFLCPMFHRCSLDLYCPNCKYALGIYNSATGNCQLNTVTANKMPNMPNLKSN